MLGAEAAEVELRAPGDKLFSPETGRTFYVEGVLQRGGTSDDSRFFIPLKTAQEMFGQTGRLTAVAVRLHDPLQARAVAERMQALPGVQVVTVAEMMGVFLNLLASARSLLLAIHGVAIAAAVLTLLNTLLAAVLARAPELSVMRAIGASRSQVFALITCEALLLTAAAGFLGLLLIVLGGGQADRLARTVVPFAPGEAMVTLDWNLVGRTALLAVTCGLLAAFYPAWRAATVPPANALKEC
jgi:putative ABC transport system permease protein